MNKFIIQETESGLRIDKVLAIYLEGFSRTHISKLIEDGQVKIEGKPVKASYKVKTNEEVEVEIPEVKPLEIKSEDIPLDIVYEDDDILIINKPQGMVVHPSNGHNEGTLVNAILHHCDDLSGINGVARPGIIHRIDKDTSGLICIAKNDAAHIFLSEQLKTHSMQRTYIALLKGVIKENSGEINLPIGRDPHNRQRMAVIRENSKEAVTYFKVLQRFDDNTLVECRLKTGRTHQIRVHMAYIGYPVEGDPLYGGRKYDRLYKDGQLLVAYKLKLVHPRTKQEMEFEIPLPNYFEEVIKNLDNKEGLI